MNFCRECMKCGKMYLMSLFDRGLCAECEKAEQEPCDDAVSRGVFEQVKWERDIAIEQLHELGYELGQKIEPCDDVVSRQAVLKIIDGWYEQNRDTENIEDLIVLITYMDSVRPQEPKTGKWKFVCQHWRKCSECGFSHKFAEDWKYCPSCGAEMDMADKAVEE